MTINELEAKCREKIEGGVISTSFDPKLILQLIEERRLLARLAADSPQFNNPTHAWAAKDLRDRVLQEADECES